MKNIPLLETAPFIKTIPPTKHELALLALLDVGMDGLSKLNAIHFYGETSLPTTISELGLKRGFRLDRQMRKHCHRHGGMTSFSWYWLADRNEAIRAVSLVNRLRKARHAPLISERSTEELINKFPLAALRVPHQLCLPATSR